MVFWNQDILVELEEWRRTKRAKIKMTVAQAARRGGVTLVELVVEDDVAFMFGDVGYRQKCGGADKVYAAVCHNCLFGKITEMGTQSKRY